MTQTNPKLIKAFIKLEGGIAESMQELFPYFEKMADEDNRYQVLIPGDIVLHLCARMTDLVQFVRLACLGMPKMRAPEKNHE